jgi:hypothetical protein
MRQFRPATLGIDNAFAAATLFAYRIAAFFMLALLDDPAMLALAFC